MSREDDFSLDELVFKLADLFERKAFAELLRLILDLVQEILLSRILNGKIDAMKCCTTGHLLLNGTFKRQFRTSLGEFTMKLWRVKCTSCGKTFSPLQRFLKLRSYQTKTNELEKTVTEAVSAEPYRRAHQEMKSLGKTAVPVSTMNRWVMKTDCDEIEISRNVIGSMPVQIMPDGTKFKGPGENGEAHRKKDIEARMQAAELAVAQLISYIDSCGYSTAANYLRRVQFGMFGYVRR